MQEKCLAVGAALVLAFTVSSQSVLLTGASPATVDAIESGPPSVGLAAAVVPLAPAAEDDAVAAICESVSDATVLGITGAALLFVAAGVRRNAL